MTPDHDDNCRTCGTSLSIHERLVSRDGGELYLCPWTEFDPDFAAIGAIEPVFVSEVTGHYTQRIVIDSMPRARAVPEAAVIPDQPIAWHYEQCDPIPQYRPTLRWCRTTT